MRSLLAVESAAGGALITLEAAKGLSVSLLTPRGCARSRLLGLWQMAPVTCGFLCFQNIVQEKLGPSCAAAGNIKWCSSYGKRHGGSSKQFK